MTRRKITPNFRFKDFDDEWEYTKLIDKIASLKSGLSRELSVKDIGLPVVRANNINNGKLNFGMKLILKVQKLRIILSIKTIF